MEFDDYYSMKAGIRKMNLAKAIIVQLIALILLFQANTLSAEQDDAWVVIETTQLKVSINRVVEKDQIFETSSGNFYKSKALRFINRVLVNPQVTVYKARELYQLKFNEINLTVSVEKVQTGTVQLNALAAVQEEMTIESYIVSGFRGYAKGNKYELANSQVWEQVDALSDSWLAIMPSVTIWQSGKEYKMKIAPSKQIVTVRRIK